jgi:hypothetical protein
MRRELVEGGIVAGLVGGLVSTMLGAVMMLARRMDVWPIAKGAAFPFLGDVTLQPGFDPSQVALGLLCHFAVTAFWGLLFAVAFRGLTRPATVAAGFFWGIVSWVVTFYVVMPLVGANDIVADTPIWMALVQYLGFGGALGVAFLPFQTPLVRRPWDERDIYVRP